MNKTHGSQPESPVECSSELEAGGGYAYLQAIVDAGRRRPVVTLGFLRDLACARYPLRDREKIEACRDQYL